MTGLPGHKPNVRITRRLPAPAQEVFDAWIDADSVMEWMAVMDKTVARATLDVRVGGKLEIVMRGEDGDVVNQGEYVEIDPPRRLVFSWRSPSTGGRRTLVSVEFHGDGEFTDLVLTHEDLPDARAMKRHEIGWDSIVDKLASKLGGRQLGGTDD